MYAVASTTMRCISSLARATCTLGTAIPFLNMRNAISFKNALLDGLARCFIGGAHLSYSPTFIRRTKCSETGAMECQKDVNVLDSSISEITEVCSSSAVALGWPSIYG